MFEKEDYQGIYVYLYYNREAKKLSRYGDVIYHSKRFRYVHLYCPTSRLKETVAQLRSLKFIKRVRVSKLDEVDQDFVGNLQR